MRVLLRLVTLVQAPKGAGKRAAKLPGPMAAAAVAAAGASPKKGKGEPVVPVRPSPRVFRGLMGVQDESESEDEYVADEELLDEVDDNDHMRCGGRRRRRRPGRRPRTSQATAGGPLGRSA